MGGRAKASLTREDPIEEIAQMVELHKHDAKLILETICDAMVRAIRSRLALGRGTSSRLWPSLSLHREQVCLALPKLRG
jgi:hypothetical protein